LKILVQDLSRNVAIAEEFRNEPAEKIKSGGLMHDRRVSRIITPGTLIDENFIDPYTNNYILAIHVKDVLSPTTMFKFLDQNNDILDHAHSSPTPLGLAWLDLSTGSFFTQSITSSTLPSALTRIMPSEIVLDESLRSIHGHGLFQILEEDRHIITYYPSTCPTPVENWTPMLEAEITPDVAKEFTPEEISAGSFLLYYVKTRLPSSNMRLQPPLRYQATEIMSIDKNSMRALEIKETIRDGTMQGSLLHSIRRTVTRSGARLLEEWLSTSLM
jgi:DNA mismatch repair ATPase MutS